MTSIVDLNAWRRVCLDAYSNLSADTTVTMGDVDAVLVAGARAAVLLDTSTMEGATAYGHLIDRVSRATGVWREDVDAILTMCAKDAAGLLREPVDPDHLHQETTMTDPEIKLTFHADSPAQYPAGYWLATAGRRGHPHWDWDGVGTTPLDAMTSLAQQMYKFLSAAASGPPEETTP